MSTSNAGIPAAYVLLPPGGATSYEMAAVDILVLRINNCIVSITTNLLLSESCIKLTFVTLRYCH
jgi:hypothetical protein